MLTDTDLRVFLKGANNYFTETTATPAEIGVPYETGGDESVMLDFSAVIGVTGNHTGCVFFTAPRAMILQLVKNFGDPDTSDAICCDFVGEIANTIAAHAREDLGSNFMISPPVTFRGQADARMPKGTPAFVITINWQGHRANLVIAVRASS